MGVWRDGTFGVVQVADTGIGIPPDLHRAVFERFVRATHEGSGCGLGLAIVKSIAERHAGQVPLTSVAPHGLQIRIAVPLARGGRPRKAAVRRVRGAANFLRLSARGVSRRSDLLRPVRPFGNSPAHSGGINLGGGKPGSPRPATVAMSTFSTVPDDSCALHGASSSSVAPS